MLSGNLCIPLRILFRVPWPVLRRLNKFPVRLRSVLLVLDARPVRQGGGFLLAALLPAAELAVRELGVRVAQGGSAVEAATRGLDPGGVQGAALAAISGDTSITVQLQNLPPVP